MPISCTIIFDHRNRTKPDQEGPVELRFIYNRKAYYIHTGISAKKNEIISGTIINRPDAEELNARLLILTKRANAEINACIDRGHIIDVQSIKRKLYGTAKVSSTSLLDWMTEQIPTLHLCDGTAKHYASSGRTRPITPVSRSKRPPSKPSTRSSSTDASSNVLLRHRL